LCIKHRFHVKDGLAKEEFSMKFMKYLPFLLLVTLFCSGSFKATASNPLVAYTVHKGDTLYHIAKLYRTSVEQLQVDNHIQNVSHIQIGQRIKVRSNVAFNQKQVKKVIRATLTAYTAGIESTGKTPSHPAYGITASGARVREGRTIAVDPRLIPIGSVVYIEGVGIRVAEDTGSAIRGAKIDVYMNNVDAARQFGVKRNRKVYVLSQTI
jgi:3D (Asp-Asp-Asp) domain-containing protein